MTLPLFLPCAAGVETLLGDEVARLLPDAAVRTVRGGVALDGGPHEVMTLNLESRLAQRVLIEVAHGPYRDEHDVHALALGVDWGAWITPRHTLRVDTTAHRSPLRSLNFAALRVKDAVCDVLRDETGERPSVDTRDPDLALVLHLGEADATLYVDSSGESLFKRGWREDQGDAPLKETLAAALLAAAGWRGTPDAGGALHDPCCGSGTIAIEAAQIACGVAPGLKRRFGFERLLPFATDAMRAALQRLRSHAQARIHPSAVPIVASDVSFRMVDFARRNAQRAGVADAIEFHGGDALERPAPALPPGLPGTLVVNPPYGERIEAAGKAGPARAGAARGGPDRGAGRGPRRDAREDDEHDHDHDHDFGRHGDDRDEPGAGPRGAHADDRAGGDNRALPGDFFARLAAHWKRAYTGHPAGWTAYVLSPDMKLPGAMRLKATRRVPLWNGPIECRLFRFDLVAGSARDAPRGSD